MHEATPRIEASMTRNTGRDIKEDFPLPEFIEKLWRPAMRRP
jgi:hypothetical protein